MKQNSVVFVGDVPLPMDILVKPGDPLVFSGIWTGRWDSVRNHVLVIEGVDQDGVLDIIYAVGDGPNDRGAWFRHKGRVENDVLTLSDGNFFARYWVAPTGRMRGVYRDNQGFAVLERQVATEVLTSPGHDWFTIGAVQRVRTEMVEDGRPVGLNTVLIRPKGDGPFPMALLNHGSTGSGRNPDDFKHVWRNDWLADSLNAKGWLVAFPQRRGRGGSDGLYNEGFCADRTQGYSPKASIALLGAERALTDANAVLFALLRHPDVARGRVLVGGESRGGVVALLQAGVLEGGVAGVLNFVGGWVGEHWGDREVNPTLFKRVGGYRGPVLSIYGRDDPYYSVAHSRSNLAELDRRGVTHQLKVVSVPGEQSGHGVMWSPHLWEEAMEAFLEGIS